MTNLQKYLYAPGPIRIPQSIKYTFLEDPPYFTTDEFSELLKQIQWKLRDIFRTSNPVMIGTGSGSLGMEASVSNFFNTGDEVLVLNTGKYGSNWVKICRAYGLNVSELPTNLGDGINLNVLESTLKTHAFKYKGIFITHVETTTGVVNPLERIKEVFQKHSDGLIIVDAVSSLLTENLNSEKYDVVLSASQKALSIPPGLFFMTISDKAKNFAENSKLPKFYFDINVEYKRTLSNTTSFTPASNLILALNSALDSILNIGISSVQYRCYEGRKIVEQLVPMFSHFVKNPAFRCNAVTAFKLPDGQKLVPFLENNGIIVGGGVRKLKHKIFRIMHFGWDLNLKELQQVITQIKLCSDPYP